MGGKVLLLACRLRRGGTIPQAPRPPPPPVAMSTALKVNSTVTSVNLAGIACPCPHPSSNVTQPNTPAAQAARERNPQHKQPSLPEIHRRLQGSKQQAAKEGAVARTPSNPLQATSNGRFFACALSLDPSRGSAVAGIRSSHLPGQPGGQSRGSPQRVRKRALRRGDGI